MEKEYLTELQIADYLKISVHTIRSYRQRKKGPPYIKSDTGLIRYVKEDVDKYMVGYSVEN